MSRLTAEDIRAMGRDEGLPRNDKPNDLAPDRGNRTVLTIERDDEVFLPREIAKTFVQPAQPSTSRSILDLENSDPDFSKRYPPLISLRKSKTISGLAQRSRSPFLADINPEAEISRFPSVSQIEHRLRSEQSCQSLGRNPGASAGRWSFDEDRPSRQQGANCPKVVDAPVPTLPGAWPEPRPEFEGPAPQTSEESSGAFFDRMTRSRSPERTNKTSQYIPAHLRRPSRLSLDTSSVPDPFGSRLAADPSSAPRRVAHPLTVDTSCAPRFLHRQTIDGNSTVSQLGRSKTVTASKHDTTGPQLGRSHTVTASNPAARLTKPFDPLEDLRQSRLASGLPRRGGTERYRRRPYNDSFTGAGRMPWESFENVARSNTERPAASRPEGQPRAKRDFQAANQKHQSPTGTGFGIPNKVSQCVKQLRDMGYGNHSPHEANRLSIYAAVCSGNVMDAVEMIEEDRKAGLERQLIG